MFKKTLKSVYVLILLCFFISFFGIPNFKKLTDRKTIFSENKIKVSSTV